MHRVAGGGHSNQARAGNGIGHVPVDAREFLILFAHK